MKPNPNQNMQTHLSVLQFAASLTENRVFRMMEKDGSSKVGQFKRFDSGRIYYINLGKALRQNKIPNPNSVSITRIAKIKLI